MKKIIYLFIILLIMCGCKEKETDMERIEYQDNKLILNLNLSIGTGYDWLEVYKSDNVTIDKDDFTSLNKNPNSTGGRGIKKLECSIDGDDAYLILKHGRSWGNVGDYETFIIKSENNKIVAVEEKIDNFNDIQYIYTSNDEKTLNLGVLKDYTYEEREDGLGFLIKNNDGQFSIYYNQDLEKDINKSIYIGIIKINDKEYRLYENETEFYLFNDGVCCIGEQAINRLDVIKMLDSIVIE
ncbi:MAG: hypothetical protein IJH31_06995 [Erysipelotrichaceae bacterium]|nr:hypothetical protein [Erysipelotrichaceae bacterium]